MDKTIETSDTIIFQKQEPPRLLPFAPFGTKGVEVRTPEGTSLTQETNGVAYKIHYQISLCVAPWIQISDWCCTS